MIDATNISRVFRRTDMSMGELILQCKAIIKDNKILLKLTRYRKGTVKDDEDRVFYSMQELFEHYDKLKMDKLVEVKGVPVKIIGNMHNKDAGKGFMATSDIFRGLDIMPIKSIENTLVIDYADINYLRAVPLSYILDGIISEAGGDYIVSSSEALSDICMYPIPLFDKILWSESKIG